MKLTNILLAFLLVTACIHSNAQNAALKDYKLSIEVGNSVKENRVTYWVVPVTLTNNSKDTLKFGLMSCSWQDYYHVSNSKLRIELTDCDKNIPIIISLGPGQTFKKDVRLIIPQTLDASKVEFKMGLSVIKLQGLLDVLDKDDELKAPKNIVWSNVIEWKYK